MKQKIHILPETLCNQIAAGEVVERPASVVKELLENSLDAGAGEIQIEVSSGGKRMIRIMDDGEGMNRDDLFLCLERHATSKISSEEDLFRLRSLGFRGEALPSIAAISRMVLRSRTRESDEGWEIVLEGGTVRKAGAAGMPPGTTIEVRDLFFNTPGRRKFLRRDQTELGHVGDVVTRVALGRPDVHLRLVQNGRSMLEAYRHRNLKERIGALLGRPILKDLLPIESSGPEDLNLQGYVSRPDLSRSTFGSAYTFINGRYIRDRLVQHAIVEAYRHLLPRGRYPVAVLYLEMDPSLVDFNVHPTKHEVRFRNQNMVHDFIAGSIRNLLKAGRPVSVPRPETSARQERPLAAADPELLFGTRVSDSPPDVQGERQTQRVRETLEKYAATLPDISDSPRHRTIVSPAFSEPPKVEGKAEKVPPGLFSSLAVIGQYRRSYLLCQDGDDLLLIDQHAAHERIGFERLRNQYRKGGVESQALLFPVTVEFDFREAALLEENLGRLERFGFELEPFGGRTYVLKSVPRLLGDASAERLLRDVASELAAIGKSSLIEEALDDFLAVLACHSVIRANRGLSDPEIKTLLSDMDKVDFNAHCPHGRPVMKRLTLSEIERMFKRT